MGRTEIPDIEVCGGEMCALVDVSVVHSSGAQVAGRIDAAVAERVAEKRAKYDRAVAMAGATDKAAFVVEDHGAISEDADSFLNRMARVGSD